jgi:uncharacterized RDD family membrane protein YckC
MSRRAQENLAAAVVLAVFVGVIVLCQDFGPRARMIPLPLAILGVVLTVIQIVWQNLRSTDELQMDMIAVPAPGVAAPKPETSAEAKPSAGKAPSWREEAAAFGIVAVLLALVLLIGPVPAVFVFTGGYFLFTRHYSFRAGLIYTAVFTAATYLLFFVALEIQPYHGVLAPIIERFQ